METRGEQATKAVRIAAMDRATQRALAAHNHSFYRAHAAAFSATRDYPWPGWERVARALPAEGPVRALDAGCGNGRLGAFLGGALAPRPVVYTGVDSCESLLRVAGERCPRATLVQSDLVEQPLDRALPQGPFDLVCAFGLLHHIPAFTRRRALIEALAERVAPGGMLALAFWRFGDHPRFDDRRQDWQQVAEVDPGELEPGDHLVAWGSNGAGRYCHASDDREIEALVSRLPLGCCDDFTADGREGDLNRYLVFVNRERLDD